MFGECTEGLLLALRKKKLYRDMRVCFKSSKIKFQFECYFLGMEPHDNHEHLCI